MHVLCTGQSLALVARRSLSMSQFEPPTMLQRTAALTRAKSEPRACVRHLFFNFSVRHTCIVLCVAPSCGDLDLSWMVIAACVEDATFSRPHARTMALCMKLSFV